jgi:hypothetical protein
VNGRRRTDPAVWLLTLAAWLLPRQRRGWGRAMRAELAAVSTPGERWRFAVGCLRAVLANPATLRRVGYPLASVGVVVVVVAWTGRVGYPPLRWSMVTATVVLVGLAWWGRHAGPLGPVGAGASVRAGRVCGFVVVGAVSVWLGVQLYDKTENPGPLLTILLAAYLVGVLALTAQRSAVTGRVLLASASASLAATALWSGLAVAFAPIPADIGLALVVTMAGMGLAAWLGAGRGDGTGARVLAALAAGTLTPLLVLADVAVLSSYGPAWLIPNLVPAALTPADRLYNSRIELVDPYIAMLLVAAALAVALTVGSLATRHTPDDVRDEQPLALSA